MMDGFQKIELKNQDGGSKTVVAQPNVSEKNTMKTKRNKSKKLVKPIATVVTVLAVIALILVFILVIPLQKVLASAKQTEAQLKVFETAVKSQNIDEADQALQTSKTDLADTQKKLNALGYLQFIPIAAWYYADGQHAMKAGAYGLDTAQVVINDLKPYADLLGLQGKGTFTGGTAQQRIATAVLTLGKITPDIGSISDQLDKVQTEIDAINQNHYPSWLFGKKIGSSIAQAKTLVDESVVGVNQARPFITELPVLLGENSPQKYFIIFQNDKELRPGGGFITGYSIFQFDKGAITPETSADIYPLDDSIANKPAAPAPLVKYLHLTNPVFNLRDSNLSPDYLTNIDLFKQMYAKSSGYEAVDGYIAIDTDVLITTIGILDHQIYAGGINFTDATDPHCDCPQALYQLENDISRPVNYQRTNRKSLLGVLLSAILQKSLQSSPKKYWPQLFQAMVTLTAQKHILFALNDTDAQKGLEALNAAGQIKPFDGDYLSINDANFGGNKANLYTTEAVTNQYDVASDGTITKTVTLQYANNHAPSDCSLADGGLCLNAPLRDWLRIYVPKGSTLVSNTGSEVKMTTYDELDKTVFDGFLTIRPLSKATYSVVYKLPFKLKSGSSLPMLIQKQAGTYDNQYTVIYNNNTVATFPLLTDKTLDLK